MAKRSTKAQLFHNLSQLPEMCAAFNPSDKSCIFVKAGERGFYPALNKIDARYFNETRGITPSQVNAMLTGSMFGFEVPGADASDTVNLDPRNDPYAFS